MSAAEQVEAVQALLLASVGGGMAGAALFQAAFELWCWWSDGRSEARS